MAIGRCVDRSCLSAILVFWGIFLLTSQIFAETGPPLIINYQGVLNDAQGNPVTGQKTMSFRIYGSPTATTAIWSSGDVLVSITKGAFSVNLGETPQKSLPEDLFTKSDKRYLGVTVGKEGTGTELPERKRLVSVPYALNAGSSVPKGVIVMWSGEVVDIPNGWALCDGQDGRPNLMDRFIVGAGNVYTKGAVGGAASVDVSHSHTVASHQHGIAADGGHAHHLGPYDLGNWVGPDITDSVQDGSGATPAGSDHMHRIDMDTGWGGGHSHGGATGSSSPATNTYTNSIDNRPPYYALCFIIKL